MLNKDCLYSVPYPDPAITHEVLPFGITSIGRQRSKSAVDRAIQMTSQPTSASATTLASTVTMFQKQKSMEDTEQEKPLAPALQIHPRPITVDEALSTELKAQRQGFQRRTIWCGTIAAIILIIAVVMLVLGLTILHVKNPKIKMNSVAIIGLDLVNATDLVTGNANLTVVADVSVKNPNVAAFKFEKSNSSLFYHETVVGVADVPPGMAKARRTLRLNVTFEVQTAKIAGDPRFVSDFTAGILPVTSYTEINGRVKIINFIKRKVTVTMNCSIDVNVTTWGIARQDCKSHVSF